MKKILPCLLMVSLSFSILLIFPEQKAFANMCVPDSAVTPGGCTRCGCDTLIGACQTGCVCTSDSERGSPDNKDTTIGHITDEFGKHRMWMVELFFKDSNSGDPPGLLAAMQLMAEQLNTVSMLQVQAIGSFFDAKHQLETQRLFQKLTSQAHKDYHPSEGVCAVGTLSRSLAASNRKTELSEKVIATRLLDRTVMSKESTAYRGLESDPEARLVNFIQNYCDQNDNNKNLNLLCLNGSPDPLNVNKDINYTQTIGDALTLDIDFSDGQTPSVDEAAVIALSQNLFGNRVFPFTSKNKFVNPNGEPNFEASAQTYLDVRSYLAKQNVAMHSFAAIAALKTKGEEGAQPFIYALLKEMGGDALSAEKIEKEIGEDPSYYAQMNILTKTLYQRPEFYSDLYDKPANVMRKNVAMQAATLMQKRDLYNSYLRSEMTLAVMLETLLMEEQTTLANEMRVMK